MTDIKKEVECLQELVSLRTKYGTSTFDFVLKKLARQRLESRGIRPERTRFKWSDVRRLYAKQRGICPVCDNPMPLVRGELEIDHIDPSRVDGFNSDSNRQVAHKYCNRSKGADSIAEQSKSSGKPFTEILAPEGRGI
jgi:5-methylcytosine-specific restriction endonuclease McrA